ncbi:MAG TPA: LptA/OstA family protein [Opitutaceae bacterium]
MKSLPLLAAALALAAAARAADAPAAVPETTIVSAGPAEMTSNDTESTFTFRDNVIAVGNGMTLQCDFLKVIATRIGDKAATIGKYGKFKYMLATGHVKMTQGDRVATSGRAEMFPDEDRVVLTEKPVVKIESEHYEASGPRMILYRGQRRAVIEGGAHILLPPIKDLGFPSSVPAAAPAPKAQPQK